MQLTWLWCTGGEFLFAVAGTNEVYVPAPVFSLCFGEGAVFKEGGED